MNDKCKHGLTARANCYICGIEEENGNLREFARKVIQEALDGNDVCGGDIQDWAEKFGLIRPETYDPEKHGEHFLDVMEPGDTIYVYSEVLKKGREEQTSP